MVIIPIANIGAVIAFDTSNRDRRRNNILSEIFGKTFSALGYVSFLDMGDESFWIVFPSTLDIAFECRCFR